MQSTIKLLMYWVAVVLLLLILLPILAASVTLAFGPLRGDGFAGGLLLGLIEHSDGPTPILQKIATLILGAIGISTLWREKARYAVGLIILCMIGIVLTYVLWIYLSAPSGGADLWQETSGPLNGMTFPPALHAYMKSMMIGFGVDLLGIFGLKGVELLKG